MNLLCYVISHEIWKKFFLMSDTIDKVVFQNYVLVFFEHQAIL